MGGKRMSQSMWADVFNETSFDQAGFQVALNTAWRQSTSPRIEEQRLLRVGQFSSLKINQQSLMRFTADRHDPFLAAFTKHTHKLIAQIKSSYVQAGQLTDTQAT